MLKVTYIGHSGFLVELEKVLFLFDYYQGEIPALPEEKRLYVFASHRHGDHFNPEIFKLAEQHPDVQYVLSRDIWLSRVPKALHGQTVQLKPRERWEDTLVTGETLKSTDEGVAFLVRAEGKTVYHAGDLNHWHWEGETEAWNRKMAEDFHKALEPLAGMRIDAAFIPLDPRQEGSYSLGMDYFLELTDTEHVYPMHCWEKYEIIDRWSADHPDSPYKERIVKIVRRGESFET